jgi:hypothetical protein
VRRPGVRPVWWRVVATSSVAAAAVLWAWSGWSWWAGAAVIAGLVVVRLALGLVPTDWRGPASRWALAALAAFVAVWVATLAPGPASGVAAGVAVLVAVAQTWRAWPSSFSWAAVGAGAALVAGFAFAAWIGAQDEAGRERAAEQARHEYQVAQLRPTQPLAVLHAVVKAVHEDDPALVCFLFTDAAERAFAAEFDATDCTEAVHTRHEQLTGPGYGNATSTDVTYGRPTAAVSGCDMYITTGILESGPPPGPAIGRMELAVDPAYPGTGYEITEYEPC